MKEKKRQWEEVTPRKWEKRKRPLENKGEQIPRYPPQLGPLEPMPEKQADVGIM